MLRGRDRDEWGWFADALLARVVMLVVGNDGAWNDNGLGRLI